MTISNVMQCKYEILFNVILMTVNDDIILK